DQVPVIGIEPEIGGIGPEDVRHGARTDVLRESLPVVVPRNRLELDVDVRMVFLECGAGLLVRGRRILVPQPEGDGRGIPACAVVAITGWGAGRQQEI